MKIQELLGKTITNIDGASKDSDEIRFTCSDGGVYRLYHDQDCCEQVRVEDVAGDVSDLLGQPLLRAEERSSEDNPPEDADSFTWTFYELATIKGSVTIRWLGESNGYYSESVDFEKVEQ
jgi:hypothetical protein